MKTAKKSNYLNLGSIIVRTDKETGEPLKDENGKPLYTILLGKDLDIKVNGKKLPSRYLNVENPVTKFERMLKKGVITQDEYNTKTERFQQGGDLSYIKFEISANLES
jgi:hypothetical protein